jgi:hypothetical protein
MQRARAIAPGARGRLRRHIRHAQDGSGTPADSLSEAALGLLLEWKTDATTTAPEALVFATRMGTPISPNNVLRRSIFPACKRLGLPRTTWLTFRRTYSSWSHDKGVPG